MTFAYPWFLVLLLLILFFYSAKKSSKVEQIFSKDILNKLQFGRFGAINLKFFLLIASFVLMVIALARPIVLSQDKQEIDVKSFNLAIALDISKSMKAEDIFPNRLRFSKKAIGLVMDGVPEANIAIIAYTNDAFLVSPFSNDFKSIEFLLSNLDTDSLSSRGSQILSALKATNKIFESIDEGKKTLLLVTDGADGRDLEKIDEYIKQKNITLHVLSIGTKKGSTLSDRSGGFITDRDGNIVVSKRDDSLMSILDGGAFLSSSGELTKIDWLVEEIKKSVEIKEVKRDSLEGAKELFYYPLALGLLLIFFAFNHARLPFLLVLFIAPLDSRAGLFDFLDIYQAKKSYEKQEFYEAEKSFSKLDSNQAKYNQANMLYRQEKFKEALKLYQSIKGFSTEYEHKRLHNIGNSYAQLGKIDEAIESYEEALKVKEDEDTRANLELMKKMQKEQKSKDSKDQDKEEDKQDSKEEEKKEKEKKEEKEEKKEKKDEEKKSKKKDEGKNKKESDKKDTQESQAKLQEGQKNISEAEAKKWEHKMDSREFKTKPLELKKGEKNEIFW
jgi:Ca-activated chloride channel family protein